MKFKAIIFDLDGTIINTEHIWQEATRQLITNKGGTHEDAASLESELCGLAMHRACARIKEALNIEDSIESLMQEKKLLATTMYHHGIQFIQGFETFHLRTRDHNLKTGIATNADDATLAIAKERLGLQTFFGEHIYSISHVQNICKPDPAVYLHAASKLNVNPTQCIAIEDSAHGIRAAQAAGMFCIGITTSNNPNQTKNADLIISKYEDIDLHVLLL
jgi:mannitol-1-/sugar-/sorbitol-6-/2-deoxyglucose-6-phosphatase